MAIRYLPKKILKKVANEKNAKKLVTKDLTLNKAAVKTLEATGVLTKKLLTEVALKVIKGYKKRYKRELSEGASKREALDETLNEKKAMVQAIENESVHAIAIEIKNKYAGEFYEWLPSDADEPDPEHQLKYGKKFQIGKGEMPGDRYGCRCGMNILVGETRLQL